MLEAGADAVVGVDALGAPEGVVVCEHGAADGLDDGEERLGDGEGPERGRGGESWVEGGESDDGAGDEVGGLPVGGSGDAPEGVGRDDAGDVRGEGAPAGEGDGA